MPSEPFANPTSVEAVAAFGKGYAFQSMSELGLRQIGFGACMIFGAGLVDYISRLIPKR